MSSSERALREIGTSFRDHDGTRLAYYLNTDAVTQQVSGEGVDWLRSQHYDELLAAAIAEVPDAERDATDSAGRLPALKSALAERGAKGIAMALTTGTSDSADVALRLLAAFAGLPPLDVILAGDHLELVGIGNPTGTGTDRVVPVELHDRDLNIPIIFSVAVHKQGPRWQVSGVGALEHTLATIDNAQQEKLMVVNRPIESRLQDLVGIGAPDIARIAHGSYGTSVRLRMRIDNHGTETIKALDLALMTQASDVEHAEMLHVDGPIPKGGAVMAEWSFDETGHGSSATAAMLDHRQDLAVRTRRVILDSAGVADTVRLYKTYRALRRRNR